MIFGDKGTMHFNAHSIDKPSVIKTKNIDIRLKCFTCNNRGLVSLDNYHAKTFDFLEQ
jgi:hypothetical protein